MSEIEHEFELLYQTKKGIVDFMLGFAQAKGEWIPKSEYIKKSYVKTLYVFEKEARDILWIALKKNLIKG